MSTCGPWHLADVLEESPLMVVFLVLELLMLVSTLRPPHTPARTLHRTRGPLHARIPPHKGGFLILI